MNKNITKKKFRELCSFHEYGKGQTKRNAIYFDWLPWNGDVENHIEGYKYMVKARVENAKKSELFDILYNWVVNEVPVPWYVEYRYAHTDDKRFKVSLMG